MATTLSVEVDSTENEVQIQELSIHDDGLVSFLDDIDDDQKEDAVIRALKVGAATLQLAETSKDLEFVKREFHSMQEVIEGEIDDVQDDLQEKFGDDGKLARILDGHLGDDGTLREHIDDAFGEDGIFSERLDEELGEDGERIQQALDPDTEGTPTYRLKQTLKNEIQDIEEKLTKEEAQAEVRQRTTLKGDDFEDTVEGLLDELVYHTSHSYEYTGDSEGELTGRDVGDFVLTLGDTGQRIVVEAKSEKEYSVPSIKRRWMRLSRIGRPTTAYSCPSVKSICRTRSGICRSSTENISPCPSARTKRTRSTRDSSGLATIGRRCALPRPRWTPGAKLTQK
ncbi:hypothetical protein [Halorarum halophilum]|uniref:hypothetical protein n=1 Tax=Halorarum halophilum TaxID=2743090 RepID=UPI001C4E3099|nr:hypothetical protein [Halobaculum halophilum]